ncbi:CcoQ/FixQ family Cbb3-type cytochrome c oxidase assembly chaperone [Meridianimarinicoccus roseus]|jgi:cbb3-type cytochrome oxidase subunit 3|uniref:CcoQ/FixQ family Cbb3-type cytochrome c oxidase assembly chaperone n=1 Tax=Meridianimarinicoccus roseus TaxID=2072018 RepID=A0A2V2LCX2_9RHOB|nr:cbb3-type cytochrome c oxidase subunit 3 [Meridianimarinicoccus roseus]PWR01611.1 CcoQ/FixQ family Cbb3-type cytochrome c oxidase assembly chaperone [Meridianimarinicoccus roseus]
METYVFLREVMGSFGLILMFVFFVTTVIWVLTGRRDSYQDTADIIFRHDNGPADEPGTRQAQPDRDSRKEARS